MPSLADTNVLSELRRPNPDRNVLTYVASCPVKDLYVSLVTLAELRYGIDILQDPSKRADLTRWLVHDVRPMFAGRVLEVTEDIMLRWRFMVEAGRKTGRTFSQPDLIIAATAIEHNLTLVTRNLKDFAGLGIALANPWVAQP